MKRVKVLSPQKEVEKNIKNLRKLRRFLCCYAAPASDRFCDCKRMAQEWNHSSFRRSGEYTGCCEVREAITKLEIIHNAIHQTRIFERFED